MKRTTYCMALAFFCAGPAFSFQDTTIQVESDTLPAEIPAQQPKELPAHVYTLKPAVDIPIIGIGTAWSVFAFSQIYSKDPSTQEQIRNLNENDVPKFDRWAAGMSDETADKNSDYPFYGSMVFPFLLLFDKEIREDAPRIGLLYWEAMSITGLCYTGGVYFFDRYRPEAYDTTLPVSVRTGGNYKDAFPAGHPALVATAMFFSAKVYSDYHPGSSFNYVMYGLAIGATGTTAYLRHIAGKHFPSDLIIGVTVGTLSGILVPQFHKTKPKDRDLGFIPFTNGKDVGFALRYKIR